MFNVRAFDENSKVLPVSEKLSPCRGFAVLSVTDDSCQILLHKISVEALSDILFSDQHLLKAAHLACTKDFLDRLMEGKDDAAD